MKDLVGAGILREVSADRYSLGPRIIELDYMLLRHSDPVLLAAVPVIDKVVKKARLDVAPTTLISSSATR